MAPRAQTTGRSFCHGPAIDGSEKWSLGRLEVPRHVWYRASESIDGVQDDKGAVYGYQQPSNNRPAMTAVGLYGRMMIGWPRNHPPLLKGAAQLATEQPRKSNMYFNYYTSQVLHHVGGKGWERSNPRMRNYLVEEQAEDGHEDGSWYFDEAWSDPGGRLYTTTLAILTFEVYYRYMPMYQANFVDKLLDLRRNKAPEYDSGAYLFIDQCGLLLDAIKGFEAKVQKQGKVVLIMIDDRITASTTAADAQMESTLSRSSESSPAPRSTINRSNAASVSNT